MKRVQYIKRMRGLIKRDNCKLGNLQMQKTRLLKSLRKENEALDYILFENLDKEINLIKMRKQFRIKI